MMHSQERIVVLDTVRASRSTAAGSNGVLRAAGAGRGRESGVQQVLEGWERVEVLLRWGA